MVYLFYCIIYYSYDYRLNTISSDENFAQQMRWVGEHILYVCWSNIIVTEKNCDVAGRRKNERLLSKISLSGFVGVQK